MPPSHCIVAKCYAMRIAFRAQSGGGGRESNPPATAMAAKPVLKTGRDTGRVPPPALFIAQLERSPQPYETWSGHGVATLFKFGQMALRDLRLQIEAVQRAVFFETSSRSRFLKSASSFTKREGAELRTSHVCNYKRQMLSVSTQRRRPRLNALQNDGNIPIS